ncbi:hypothetical protein ZTR_11062 [Talaromyces verruculosus]|nr:hypothetical protein ZTR_11062 [Talaromyces verruculosus]
MGLGVLEDHKLDHVPGTSYVNENPDLQPQPDQQPWLKYDRSGPVPILLIPQPSDDPYDPLNWPLWRRDLILAILSLVAVICATMSPIMAANTVTIALVFRKDFTQVALLTGYHLLGVGTAWAGGSKGNWRSLVAARVFQGFALAPFEALVNACVGDLFFMHERGKRMAFSNVALFGGAFLTPVVVGKMTATLGWQWSFYFVSIFTAAALPLVFFFVPETAYRRAEYLNMDFSGDISANHAPGSQTGIVDSPGDTHGSSENTQEKPHPSGPGNEITNTTNSQYSYWQTLRLFNGRKTDENFLKLFLRPFPLFFHPGILWACLTQSVLIGWTVFIGVVLAAVFLGPPLWFDQVKTGYLYTGAFVGSILGLVFSGLLSDWINKRMIKLNKGTYEPEFRIILVFFQLLFSGIGLYGFGITAENVKRYGWLIPDVFFAFVVMGMVMGAVSSALYIVDAHRQISVEAFTCMLFFKNVFSFVLTFFAYDWLVVKAGSRAPFIAIGTIQAGICLLAIPMYIFGKRNSRLLDLSLIDGIYIEMAAVRTSNGSAHLADHAATAALYATDPMRKRTGSEAVSQSPQNQSTPLPAGLTLANASAAASLAHANQKSPAAWRPERQPYAEKAAAFVRSYQAPEPAPPKQPNPDVYKAALLAAKDRVYTASPPAVTTPELKFDKAVFENIRSDKGRAPQRDSAPALQYSPGALTAATGAVSNRRRTESAPSKPMFHPDASAALTAATISHRASQDAYYSRNVLSDLDPGMEAARIHHIARTNVQLYTATPPVEIEVEEQRYKDTLRAAAVSMARDMYASAAAAKEEPSDGTDFASAAAQKRVSHRVSQSQFSWVPGDEYNATQQRPAPNLHEAAQKIAAEKLAKMQRNDLYNKQQYYGTAASPKSRQSFTRRLRRRTSSDGDVSEIDWQRSERIRHQMSSLQSRVNAIDEKKSKDRADLMEIARKNVHAAIHDMDEKVYADTGKPSPNMQREWEEKAQLRAKQESEARLTNFGRVSVGGDKYMDQTEVEAIARSRIQPTLDEIDNRVEEQRAREVEERLEQERRQRRLETDRAREAQIRAEEKQDEANQEKSKGSLGRRRSLLGSRKIFTRASRKSSGKAAENEKRREETATNGVDGQSERGSANATAPVTEPEPTAERTTEPNPDPSHEQVVSEAADADPQTNSPTSPKSESKIRSWFKGKLSRRFSKPPPPEEPTRQEGEAIATGGVSAVEATNRAAPLTSHPVRDTDLVSDLAPQRPEPEEDALPEEVSRQWSSSTEESNRRWSSSPIGEDRNRRKKGLRMSLRDIIARRSTSDKGSAAGSPLASPTTSAPAPTSGGSKTVGTGAMSSRPPQGPRMNTMERNELHDSFTEESLPPPPSLVQAERSSLSGSARDSKFSEDL